MKPALTPLAALLLTTLAALHAADAPQQKPDIVFILADDLGYADVGFNGPDIKTPSIDKLRAAGAKLESFYTLQVCTPSRCALMTGRYPIRYGRQYNVLRPGSQVGLSLDERLLPQVLREAGYATVHVGKWHLGEVDRAYLPMQRGFDHTYGFVPNHKKTTHLVSAGDLQRDEKPCTDAGWLADLYTKEAVRHIEQRDPGRPLFLYVAYNSPHSPHECPPEYSAPYARLGSPRSAYAGMVAQMDAGIGRIIAAVEKAGMRSNTLFVFASDNGGIITKGEVARNTPLRAGKGSFYEGGVRVVACAAWDGHIPAGSVVDAPFHMVDWYPTFSRLAGASVEQKLPLDGLDVWPTLAQGKPSPHDVILVNTVGREGAVRSGDWKFVRNGRSDDDGEGESTGDSPKSRAEKRKERAAAPERFELFNLARDVAETTDLSAAEPDKVKELAAKLDVFSHEAVPPILKPAGAKKEAEGGQPAPSGRSKRDRK